MRVRALVRPAFPIASHCIVRLPLVQQVRPASSKKGSSARYLARQKNDVYVKGRLQGNTHFGPKSKRNLPDGFDALDGVEDAIAEGGGYISRSAFKLVQLDDRHRFLRGNKVVVDLGAAPGGWTQVIVERLGRRAGKGRGKSVEEHQVASREQDGDLASRPKSGRVFALDLLPMHPVDGAMVLQGDFLDPDVQDRLKRLVMRTKNGDGSRVPHLLDGDGATHGQGSGFVDIIVSDMMANTTGNTIADTEASLELCRAALSFALATLRVDRNPSDAQGARKAPISAASSSVLVMKYFMSAEADAFRKQELEQYFRFVKAEKMEASRKESREQFWVCIGFLGDGKQGSAR